MNSSGVRMTKYYIALGVIGIFALVMFILVLSLASGHKQDNDTYNKANSIAEKLNTYITKNQIVPSSLNAAGINDVPDTITYTKLTDSSYKFCMNYHSAGMDLGASAFDVLGSGSLTQQAIDNSSSSNDYYSTAYTPSDLYIDSSHKKGENCQIVKPYINSCAGTIELTYPCYQQNNYPTSTTTISPTDTQKQHDAAIAIQVIRDYISGGGTLPASVKVVDDSFDIYTQTISTSLPGLQYYVKSSQLMDESYSVGVKNNTDTSTNDNLVVVYNAGCSGPQPTAQTGSVAVLYSLQSGQQCKAT